ncbi:filament-like plant protein 3 [Dendrobium catenatum]|uniref:Filament-like plant protein 3 n=1 Tax=Dendrobium catenatum TaxID=906689 RepID=A0A2I0X8Z3_9ASPA|nr:filament-like plant protein 3 [Dendrobium catenatum]PKU84350.1 Filament-like plant protein 3 [Dendrobium catenatum]
MDHQSGNWRRKPSEKNLGESDSSGSVSSYSERYSDEQEVFGSSPTEGSLNHAHSQEVSSINKGNEGHVTVKSLTEKLSAALLDVAAKEDLIKQHAKVTEEAISGWETAEAELAALKQQLEASSLKNTVLEDRISHLEEALKECVRKLRQSREEQDRKLQDALLFSTNEWESKKFELEKQLKELHAQLETAKTEAFINADKSISLRLESLEKENKSLKTELLVQSEQLRICTLERELSTQTAEAASKQHLESIKKVAKLQSECRRLQAVACRTTSTRYQIPVCHSDQESLDSLASTLISQLDQLKHEDTVGATDIAASTEIDLMDDFLEMEKLVATPEMDYEISTNNLKGESNRDFASVQSLRNELEALQLQVTELGNKVEMMENEKAQLKMDLAEVQNQHEVSCNQLALAGDKLVDMQRKLDFANKAKDAAMAEAFDLEVRRKETESGLEMAHLEVMKLSEKLELLQGKLNEKALSMELEEKLETLEGTKNELQSQLNSAYMQAEELREHVALLEGKVEEERALSAVYSTKAEANEAESKKLEIQLMLANSDLENLNKTIAVLELELKEERLTTSKLADSVETAESARRSLESQLEFTHSEVGNLLNEVRHLQEKLDEEKALSVEYSMKCQVLEEELSRRKKEAELWRITSSNGVVKLNKEKELAEAAGKLAECQKTIASLGQQLKSLTNIDEFIFESKKAEKDGSLPYISFPEIKADSHCSSEDTAFPALSNGKEKVLLPQPPHPQII